MLLVFLDYSFSSNVLKTATQLASVSDESSCPFERRSLLKALPLNEVDKLIRGGMIVGIHVLVVHRNKVLFAEDTEELRRGVMDRG
jgi:hypothetical protein